MNVLIMEDEPLQLAVLAAVVRSYGHTAALAVSGEQALERVRSEAFDLFMLDVFLPDMTALELIPLVKTLQPDARIITLTGLSSRELERGLRELGITYYMAKPFLREELQSILSHLAGLPAPQPDRRRTPVCCRPKPQSILSG